jgi:hypothetical protein
MTHKNAFDVIEDAIDTGFQYSMLPEDHAKFHKALAALKAVRDAVPKRPDHAKELYKNPSGQFRNGDGANCNNIFAQEEPGDLVVQVQAHSIGEAHYYGELIIWADKILHEANGGNNDQ